jgi:5-methylthioribose kinase
MLPVIRNALDIEQFDELLQYLRREGHIPVSEQPAFHILAGGVSNRTVLVEPKQSGPAFVLKQALARLRVATEWLSDPRRIEREALALEWLPRLTPPGTIPHLLFLDRVHHVLGMEAVPRPHENWKTLLLQGRVQSTHVEQFGQLLAALHERSRKERSELEPLFGNRTFFRTLRLEPYYRYSAEQVPEMAPFLLELIRSTEEQHLALVHGDYSPKNVLVRNEQLVLLDHEVIHFGDPAFDLGFSLAHFLSKALHLPEQRTAFLAAATFFWNTYRAGAPNMAALAGFEQRAVRHTLACLLARVAGRSPLEYLTGAEREWQKGTVRGLVAKRFGTVPELIQAYAEIFGRS